MIKERYIPDNSHDDWYFKDKYNLTRKQWFIKTQNNKYGETYNNISYDKQNYLAKIKGKGSTDYPDNGKDHQKDRVKFIPPRYDLEDLFKFDYEIMLNTKPNKRFNRIYSLEFNHEFYNEDRNEKYQEFIEYYNLDLMNGNIDIINNICQRLSQYIIDNDINMNNYVGGSVICNIALIISKYIKTGILETSIDFINEMDEKDMNETYNSYCLFLLCQMFTAHYHYVNQYISNAKTKEWWRICHIRHRYSNKDMKSKGIIPMYTIFNGEINYVLY